MLYALICTDKPHSVQTRMDNRPDHLKFLESMGDRVRVGGPFLADDGSPTGSLIVVEAQNRAEALAVAEEDPYARAGLFESVEIRPWNCVINNLEK